MPDAGASISTIAAIAKIHPRGRLERVIRGLKFVSIPSRDLPRAVAFWTGKFGFTVASEQPFENSPSWIELRLPGTDTRFVLYTPAAEPAPADVPPHVSFTTDDLARTYDELRTKGVEFEGPVRRTDWGASAVFRDSEGNSFLIAAP